MGNPQFTFASIKTVYQSLVFCLSKRPRAVDQLSRRLRCLPESCASAGLSWICWPSSFS